MNDKEALPIGTEVVVYGRSLQLGIIESGPEENLLGNVAYRIRCENGEILRRAPSIVVRRTDFATSWHVWKADQVVAGGPEISRERMDQYAAEHGGEVLYGWPEGHPEAQTPAQ
ncbi:MULTISPECIES: hypothetical protein [Mycobacteroides]|uniref:Uncharacterized protein n=1 Tax=Mycobacteroides immunogenum TaxID=83262 RepID=A0ABR5LM67_9MYCO|nr:MULTISPECIES: hypothetical protein [Mycobacteroides]AKP58771.1 hypothetical protein MAUC22_15000 [Mycobacteroides abscessus UC22]KPG28096.1 hypothetical protein AN912_22685 [Mycobacteroides immunogenum]KPG28788.1 hypothetical protein AN913_12910 [Mycobacteroides immunogenum]KPG60348.1 hypothetical protein AN918_11890 [Mycobacteroides immunogenum]MBE5465105.1 hypothetical protein [Mycobacteroides abscessus]